MTFRALDLFAGIGGFSRAVHWLGGETVAFVEWEAWNRRVLAKHWPHARFFGDIHDVGADELSGLGRIDLITGGYPCQPFSHAGKRLGAADDRHLWPEMRRVINLTRPRYVLAENVAGHINMGLDLVLSELEADGYTGRAIVVPAAAVNALHRRDRVWIMAHRNQSDGEARRADRVGTGAPACTCRCAGRHQTAFVGVGLADANGQRPQGPQRTEQDDATGRARLGLAERDARQRVTITNSAMDSTRRGVSNTSADNANHTGYGARSEDGTADSEHRQRLRAEPGRSGADESMADAATRGLRRGRAPGHDGQSALGGDGASDANSVGCESAPQRHDPAREPCGIHSPNAGKGRIGTANEAPRTLDASPHGVPAGLVRRPAARSAWNDPDVIRAMWADGSWEADLPRVVAEEAERRQKLQAAGNAIVPIVAYEILRVMLGADDA